MKKTITILLAFSFLVPSGGALIVLQIQKKLIKKEIKHRIITGIDKNEITVLRFTKAEAAGKLKWEKRNEFEYKGEMYDIVESECRGDSITYWCWHDREETKLNRRLNHLAERAASQNPQNSENAERILKFLQSLYSDAEFGFPTYTLVTFISRLQKSSFYSSVLTPPPIPPP